MRAPALIGFAILGGISSCADSRPLPAVSDQGSITPDASLPVSDVGVGDLATTDLVPCDPLSCPHGCCDAAGNCRPGADDSACGTSGSACAACVCVSLSGADGGRCASCGPSNCAGCCQGAVCVPPDQLSVAACGSGGEACVTCGAGAYCKAACIRMQPDCGPGNCPGCCRGNNLCATGNTIVACGTNGQFCQQCGGGQGCVANPNGGGLCGNVQTCDRTNCGGCCMGNVCLLGTRDAQCGSYGAPCTTCKPGETCVGAAPGGGICEKPPFCTAGNCMTCCSGNQCVAGTEDHACGGNGHPCQDCTAFGATCVNQTCVVTTPCNAKTCSGCCYGDVCAQGNQDFACGIGGTVCRSCVVQNGHCHPGGNCGL